MTYKCKKCGKIISEIEARFSYLAYQIGELKPGYYYCDECIHKQSVEEAINILGQLKLKLDEEIECEEIECEEIECDTNMDERKSYA